MLSGHLPPLRRRHPTPPSRGLRHRCVGRYRHLATYLPTPRYLPTDTSPPTYRHLATYPPTPRYRPTDTSLPTYRHLATYLPTPATYLPTPRYRIPRLYPCRHISTTATSVPLPPYRNLPRRCKVMATAGSASMGSAAAAPARRRRRGNVSSVHRMRVTDQLMESNTWLQVPKP
jgi:hypothetical protein